MSLFETLIPPPDAADNVQYAHRVRVTIVACVGFVVAVVGTGANYGVIPGFSGFARKDDLTEFHSEYISNTIFSLRVAECAASAGFARQHYSERIGYLMQTYRKLTGEPYDLPACGDL